MNSSYNILILSAGRRVELIQLFQKAARNLNLNSKIIAADCSKLAPALYFADEKVLIPRISEMNYIEEVISISNKYNISLIVPTIDTELLILAKEKNKIEEKTNAKVLISNYEVIDICRNKINTQKFMESKGFLMPIMYNEDDVNKNTNFPLFIKPISGSSSIDTYKVDEYEKYLQILDIVPNPLIQECIFGDEYTVDVFLDFDSNVISIVPRLRIATRSGEISKGKIVKDKEIILEIKKLMKVLKPIGHITVQLMKTDKGIKYIEINPRFGGGAPMSIMSGADSCANLFKLLQGERLDYNENYQENQIYLRFDSSICLNDEMVVVE